MKRDDDLTIEALCVCVWLLGAVVMAIIERTAGKESQLWDISFSVLLLPGIIVGIKWIVTRRAHLKRTTEGPTAVLIGIMVLLTFGAAFICSIVHGVLR
jgi:hypothetical protein